MKSKLFLVINIMVLFVAGVSYGQSDSSAQAEQSLRHIESEVSAAYLKGDTATLDRIWADEYTLTPQPDGHRQGRLPCDVEVGRRHVRLL